MSNLIDEAIAKADEVEQVLDKFFEIVESALDWIPDALSDLVDPIQHGLAELRQKSDEFWDQVHEFTTEKGDIDKLRAFADRWSTEVAEPVEELLGKISPDKLRSTIEWEGRAARTYQSTIPAQAAGLAAIRDLGFQIRDSLNGLAEAIESFWNTFLLIMLGLVATLIGAVLAAGSIVGIPAAIGAVITALGVATTAVLSAINSVKSTLNTVESEQQHIADKVHALGGHWADSDLGAMSRTADWEPG